MKNTTLGKCIALNWFYLPSNALWKARGEFCIQCSTSSDINFNYKFLVIITIMANRIVRSHKVHTIRTRIQCIHLIGMNSVLLLLSLHRDRGKFCAWRERVHYIIIISYLDKNINQYYFWISIISISHTIQTTVSCANKQHLATDESAIKMEFSKMSIKTNSQSIGIEYIYIYVELCHISGNKILFKTEFSLFIFIHFLHEYRKRSR